jgi:hypothetical protein
VAPTARSVRCVGSFAASSRRHSRDVRLFVIPTLDHHHFVRADDAVSISMLHPSEKGVSASLPPGSFHSFERDPIDSETGSEYSLTRRTSSLTLHRSQ